MIRYLAPWVLPIVEPPIRDGYIDCADGRIVAVGRVSAAPPFSGRTLALPDTAMLPGLVNAHTHLELSGLAGRVQPASSLPVWARQVLTLGSDPSIRSHAAIARAVETAWRAGTILVGDISNTLTSVAPLRHTRRLSAVVFREVIGFPSSMAASVVDRAVAEVEALERDRSVRITLAAHSPYAVGPDLFRMLHGCLRRRGMSPRSVHLGESIEEVQLLTQGDGPWRTLLEDLGRWDPSWTPPATGPVEYLDRLDWLGPDTLVVHGVHLDEPALSLLRQRGATLVTCPRSNVWTGAGVPPLARFYQSGVRVAIGTDSLASAPDLDVFSELAEVRRLAPSVPARQLLASATIQGARALGFDGDLGSIAVGRRSALLAVRVPAGVLDVEEYLVGGVGPEHLTWLDEA